ncbi:hypothetical protein [Polaribacter atrinae]|uniref:hypothetical protein n=1 Tax=Polaribacter atrinae TaxID=1333662 RepID=UPI0030FB3A21
MEINIAYLIGLFFGAAAVLATQYLIKDSKKREKQYENDVKENADFPAAEKEYTPTNFDEEITNIWFKDRGLQRTGLKYLMVTESELLDFAEHYHKAKS